MKSLKPFSVNLLFVFLSFLSLAMGQFASLSKSEGSNIYAFDIIVAFTAFFNFIYLLAVKKTFVVPKAILYLIAFVLVGGISLYAQSAEYSVYQLLPSFFYFFRFLSYVLFALGIFNLVKTNVINLRQIYLIIISLGIAVALAGYIQLFLLPDFTQLDPSLGWDPHKNRLASTFFDPNFVGAYLTIILVMFLSGIHRGLVQTNAITKNFIICLLSLAIILTFSRSAWFMLAVVTFFYSYFKNPKLIVAGLLLVFLAYYSVPRIQTRISGTTDPSDSAHFRLISWSNTYKIIEDYPFFGVGYNGLRAVQLRYGFADYDSFLGHAVSGSDSSILFVIATTGLVGFILFLLGIFIPFVNKMRAVDDLFTYKLVMFGLIMESQFINSLFYPQILVIWLLLLVFSYL